FIKFRERWQKVGSLRHKSWGKQQRTIWLAEIPSRRGGRWGIGCKFCSHLMHVLAQEPGQRKFLQPSQLPQQAGRSIFHKMGQLQRSLTVFRRKCMQSGCVKRHAENTVHHVATNLFLSPDRPVSELLPYDLKDQALFRGNVPQASDWISLQKMIQVMHWIVRCRRKNLLASCQSISLSVDDRADFRMLRYRRDIPGTASLQQWCELEPLACEGVLGLFRLGGAVKENTLESHDEDKSRQMSESVLELLRRACQDEHGNVDEEALQAIQQRVQHFSADQCAAVQKCGKLLASGSSLQQVVWVSADPAHQIRIATKDPLHAQESFQQQWERLFSAKHALIPDIQHSEVWRARLQAAQQYVLSMYGKQGADVDKVMSTFSFAKQRFDSTSTPMMRYCCVIRAVAILCAMQAADARGTPEVRRRAEFALQNMTPENLFRCGLTSDYAAECLSFLRSFDVDDPDVASVGRLFESFREHMSSLFIRGYVLGNVPKSSDSEPDRLKTMTQVVFEQVESPEPIYYGNKLHFLCTRATVGQVRVAMNEMRDVVEAMLGRLQVDLTEDKAHCRILQQVLAVDASVLHELSAAAQAAAPLVKAADGRGIHVCNRLAWSWTLLPQWRSRHTPRVPEPSKGFVRLVCFYLAVKLGTGKLERSLGDLVQQLNNHLGPRSEDGSTMAALVEVCLDGPQTAQDLFVRGDNGVLIPTEFARECAMAW
ncbi:unnamed protein product, partial [Symbiodinium sp. KB8]